MRVCIVFYVILEFVHNIQQVLIAVYFMVMVDNRNYIAHGNKTPKEVGREVSVNDLQRKLDHISEACAYIIELYEKYIEEQMYLKNH